MANEVTISGMISDGAVASFIVKGYEARNARPDDLRGALTFKEFLPNAGASSMRVGLFDADNTFTAMASEVASGVANVDPDWGNFALTPAVYQFPLDVSALTMNTLGRGTPEQIMVSMIMEGTGRTVTALACIAGATATAEIGDGTAPMSLDLFMEAVGELRKAGIAGPYNCVMTPDAFTAFQESVRGETGPLAFSPASAEVMQASGDTYQGSYQGVGIYITSKIVTTDTGTVSQNLMFGRNGIVYTESSVSGALEGFRGAGKTVLDGGNFGIIQDADIHTLLTTFMGVFMPAVTLGEDAAVIRIQTAVVP